MVVGVDATLVVGGLVVLAAIGFLVVLLAPWKGVRDEGPLEPDIETRLLLGEDPEQVAADADAADARRTPVVDLDASRATEHDA